MASAARSAPNAWVGQTFIDADHERRTGMMACADERQPRVRMRVEMDHADRPPLLRRYASDGAQDRSDNGIVAADSDRNAPLFVDPPSECPGVGDQQARHYDIQDGHITEVADAAQRKAIDPPLEVVAMIRARAVANRPWSRILQPHYRIAHSHREAD